MVVDPEILAIKGNAPEADILRVFDDLGIARTTWRRWERGEVMPRLSTLRKVQAALKAHIDTKAA